MMPNQNSKIKLSVQKRIAFVSVIIFAAKLIAFYITGSVGILTDALESIVNVVTGFISVYSIYVALKPEDENHPFGHGKIESLSAMIEGLLILLAGIWIIIEAIQRLFVPRAIEELGIGIIIVGAGGLLNYALGWYSIYTGRKHKSIALVAGGKHLHSDTYSSIGLVAGLVILWITGIGWIDSALAITFGIIIIFTGVHILKQTTSNLMDERDVDAIKEISSVLWKNKTQNWVEIHNLRMIKYGDVQHVDCDLVVPWYLNVKDAHKETEHLRDVIAAHYAEPVEFTIHMDACFDKLCYQCVKLDCNHRTHPYTHVANWNVKNITSKHSVHKTES